MKKAPWIFLILALAFPALGSAQSGGKAPYVKLVYFDDDREILIKDNKGKTVQAVINLVLLPEYVIQTKKSTAELQLVPNGTVVKLTQKTTFKIESLQGYENAPSNDFTLNAGKLRVVANKIVGNPATYSIKTASSVCGVRGTDFAMNFDSETGKDWLCVTEGLVDFQNLATNAVIPVAAGQFVDVAKAFEAVLATPTWITNNLADVKAFEKAVLPNGQLVSFDPDPTAKSDAPAVTGTDSTVASGDPDTTGAKDPAKPDTGKDAADSWLGKLLGLEIGSVTIEGKTYSKAVISPRIDLDAFKLHLYLPVIYTTDLFNPNDWYHPKGNNEWSFGFDPSFGEDYLARALDFTSDLALKIKSFEMGRQGFDSFYLKLGNLDSMTIGNGSIIKNFANDEEFPAVRKVGLNMGVTFNPVILEALVDDLSGPQVVGGRLGFAIIPESTEVGISAIVDTNMGANMPSEPGVTFEAPKFVNVGADFTLFKFKTDLLRFKVFADAGAWIPYFSNEVIASVSGVPQIKLSAPGFQWETAKNFGGVVGLNGKAVIIDFDIDVRYAKGIYVNRVFGPDYNRSKNNLIDSLFDYYKAKQGGTEGDLEKLQTLGINGQASADVLGIVKFTAGYYWPWQINPDTNQVTAGETDHLIAKVEVVKDKIPFVDLSGSVSYERTKFGPTVWDIATGSGRNLYLFDANTVVKGEVIYGLDKHLDLVIGVTTNIVRDASGKVTYESDKLTPKVAPSLSLETRISF